MQKKKNQPETIRNKKLRKVSRFAKNGQRLIFFYMEMLIFYRRNETTKRKICICCMQDIQQIQEEKNRKKKIFMISLELKHLILFDEHL